jgi:hypothetical protein
VGKAVKGSWPARNLSQRRDIEPVVRQLQLKPILSLATEQEWEVGPLRMKPTQGLALATAQIGDMECQPGINCLLNRSRGTWRTLHMYAPC